MPGRLYSLGIPTIFPLMLEFNFNDTFKNIKYLDEDSLPFKSRVREVKIIYFEQF